jgi:hypothetical protein
LSLQINHLWSISYNDTVDLEIVTRNNENKRKRRKEVS